MSSWSCRRNPSSTMNHPSLFQPQPCSSDDVNFILNINIAAPAMRSEQAKHLIQRHIVPLVACKEHVKETFMTVRETCGLESAAYYLWVSMESWIAIEAHLNCIFEDDRYPASPQDNAGPWMGEFISLTNSEQP